MFEKIIEKLILSYLGDYIENIDKDKLSVGLWSGSLQLENIQLKKQAFDKLKLPFKLTLGLINKLNLKIPWKSNFSESTEIEIDGINVVLSVLDAKNWQEIDYTSYESKIQMLVKYSMKKNDLLIENFNSINKEKVEASKGYTDRIFTKIMDNLHVVIKNISVRIEENTISPYYAIGIRLSELLVINTNKSYEIHFVDRNVDKDAIIYKLLRITEFGLYLKVNEDKDNFISLMNDKTDVEKYNQLKNITENEIKNNNRCYIIEPFNLSVKMQQMNEKFDQFEESSEKEKNNQKDSDIKAKLSFFINFPSFKIGCFKEQYDCIFRILNQITKYQKFQNMYYDLRKYNYFKPRYKILDKNNKPNIIKDKRIKNENAILWFKFAIDMVVKSIKYYKGKKKIFAIPETYLTKYKKKYQEIYEGFYQNFLNTNNTEYDFIDSEDEYIFKRIITSVDLNILQKWSDKIIENEFKQKKIEEKRYEKSSYFSYYFGYGKIEEDKLFTDEEKKKLDELLMDDSNKRDAYENYNKNINDLYINFILEEGRINCYNQSISKAKKSKEENKTKQSKIMDGFNLIYNNISFEMLINSKIKKYIIKALLGDMTVTMFTEVNETKTNIPLTYIDNISNDKTDNKLISFELAYTPSEDINSNLYFHVRNFNMIYHQTFIERLLRFFMIKNADEKLVGNMVDRYNDLRKKTELTVSSNITKKNIIKIEIDSRQIIIPINKYDIKNSKCFVLTLGSLYINTDENINTSKNEKENSEYLYKIYKEINTKIYNQIYDVNLGETKLSFYNNYQKYNLGKLNDLDNINNINNINNNANDNSNINLNDNIDNAFNLISNISGILRIAVLNKNLIDQVDIIKDNPEVKVILSLNNVTLNFTEYLYNLIINLSDILAPTKEKDLWTQLILNKKDILQNSKATAIVLKKNWFKGGYEKYMAVVSGGYIYFYKNNKDEEYSGYYYLKDSEIISNHQNLSLIIKNDVGTIELQYQTESKYKQWIRCLNERIEEMKNTYQEEIVADNDNVVKKEENSASEDKVSLAIELYLHGVNLFLYENKNGDAFRLSNLNSGDNNISNNNGLIKLFNLEIKKMNFRFNVKEEYNEILMSIYSFNVFDFITEIKEFNKILTSENTEVDIGKNTQLIKTRIILYNESSKSYKENNIKISLEFGYLSMLWNPESLKRLLKFLVHGEELKLKIKKDIIDPNEKLVEQKFIQQKKNDDKTIYPSCNQKTEIYIKIDVEIKGIDIIWIQPTLNIMYHQIKLSESNISCDMLVDHFILSGELGNTQIFDLCEYPFIIENQSQFNIKNKYEIFGMKKDLNEKDYMKNLISFRFESYTETCPFYKDNYIGKADVQINSIVFVHVQEQFIRFLNYFLFEFLGVLAPPEKEDNMDNEKSENYNESQLNKMDSESRNSEALDLNSAILESNINSTNDNLSNKEKIGKNVPLIKMKISINNPKIILAPRYYFKEYFTINLGNIDIQAYYKKVKGKIFMNKEEYRWVSTYQMKLSNFLIQRNDGFNILTPSNGIVNMHFTMPESDDIFYTFKEMDQSLEIDCYFEEFKLNLRQKDYILLLKCNDLNIMYTDNKGNFFDYEKDKLELKKKLIIENKKNSNDKIIDISNKVLNNKISKEKENNNIDNIDNIDNNDNNNNNIDNIDNIDNNLGRISNDIIHNLDDINEEKLSNIKIEEKKNNNDEKDDLSKYVIMYVSTFINKISISLFHENKDEFAELNMDSLYMNFVQKRDNSSFIKMNISNTQIYTVLQDNSKEILLSDFTQIISKIEEKNVDDFNRIGDNIYNKRKTVGNSGDKSFNSIEKKRGKTYAKLNIGSISNNKKIKEDKNFDYKLKDKSITINIDNINNSDPKNDEIENINQNEDSEAVKRITFANSIDKFNVKKPSKNNSEFSKKYLKLINECVLDNNRIIDEFGKAQINVDMEITPLRDKIYNVTLEGIKFLIRLDTLYLINNFFVEGMPFYDPNSKDLPNLFDSNEDNNPGMKVNMEIRHPLICLLSDKVSNTNQEMYCISSEIQLELNKEQVSRLKKKIKKEHNEYVKAIEKLNKNNIYNNIVDIIRDKLKNLKYYTFKMSCKVIEISPFICTLDDVLNSSKLVISKRKITDNFDFIFNSTTKLNYDDVSNGFKEKNETEYITSKINASMSFRDLVLSLKILEYFNKLQTQDYQRKFDNLMYYSREKKKYEENANMKKFNKENMRKISVNNDNFDEDKNENENLNIINTDIKNSSSSHANNDTNNKFNSESIYLDINDSKNNNSNNIDIIDNNDNLKADINKDINTNVIKNNEGNNEVNEIYQKTIIDTSTLYKCRIEEFNLCLIDNQHNSYFPFLNTKISKLEIDSSFLENGSNNSNLYIIFYVMTYNFIAGIWEPLIEDSNIMLISSYTKGINDKTLSKYVLNILPYNNNPFNINISDLSLTYLYSIFTRWNDMYQRYNKKYKNLKEKINYVYKESNIFNNNSAIKSDNVDDLRNSYLKKSIDFKMASSSNMLSKYNIKGAELEEKSMKISNHTFFNYTGRTVILYRVQDKNENKNNINNGNNNNEDIIDDIDNSSMYNQNPYEKAIAKISPGESYEIEYQDSFSSEFSINDSNKKNFLDQNISYYNDKIKFELDGMEIKENEIKINRVYVKKLQATYIGNDNNNIENDGYSNFYNNTEENKVKFDDELYQYSYIVSKVELYDKKKYIYLYSPLAFHNKTEYEIDVKLTKRDKNKASQNVFKKLSGEIDDNINIEMENNNEIDDNSIYYTIKPKEIFGIPFEYLNGTILFSFEKCKTKRQFNIIDFFTKDEINKELEFSRTFLYLRSNSGETTMNKVVYIRAGFSIRNLLPFVLKFSTDVTNDNINKNKKNLKNNDNNDISTNNNINDNIEYISLNKGESVMCKNISIEESFWIKLKFLEFSTKEPIEIFNKANKRNKTKIIDLYDINNNKVEIICTIYKIGKITIVFHPISIIINHVSDMLRIYYGKYNSSNDNSEVPGKLIDNLICEENIDSNDDKENNRYIYTKQKANVFLVKNGIEKIHLRINEYVSDAFPINVIGSSNTIECKYNHKEKKKLILASQNLDVNLSANVNSGKISKEKMLAMKNYFSSLNELFKSHSISFVVQNKLFLISKDLDLYCSAVEIFPKYIIYNKLNYAINVAYRKNEETLNEKLQYLSKENIAKIYSNNSNDGNANLNEKLNEGDGGIAENLITNINANDNNNINIDTNSNINDDINSYIYSKNLRENIVLTQEERKPFYFFDENTKLIFTLYENDLHWEKSKEIDMKEKTFFTFKIINLEKTMRKFINISTKSDGISTYITLSESKIEDTQIKIENYCEKISMKIYQDKYKNDAIFVNCLSKSIFTWNNQEESNIICFSFGIGSLEDRPLMEDHIFKYQIGQGKIIKLFNDSKYNMYYKKYYNNNYFKRGDNNNEECNYPYEEKIILTENKYLGYSVKLSITTDGLRYFISLTPDISDQPNSTDIINNTNSQETSYELLIRNMGISIISDNTYTQCIKGSFSLYKRNEICYITLEGLKMKYSEIEENNKKLYKRINFTCGYVEIDNQISAYTNFPVVLIPNYDSNTNNSPEFINVTYETESNITDSTFKILKLSFKIHSFQLNLESALVAGFLNLMKNMTLSLETSITKVHPLFLSDEENEKNGIFVQNSFFAPQWVTKEIEWNTKDNVVIDHLETSEIEIILSFISENKDKLFEELLENNPVLKRISTTLFSNIEKTYIKLNKEVKNNVIAQLSILPNILLSSYSQSLLLQVMKIGVNLELLGMPLNLVHSLGSGVQGLVRRPLEGAMDGGVLGGARGLASGLGGLVKSAADGFLTWVARMTSGVSRQLLLFSKDDSYINRRERLNIVEKPLNAIEGIGFGITAAAGGIYAGVCDVVREPLIGAKDGIRGFGIGLLKGFGGLVVKPLSGMVDLISKTCEGLKNTWSSLDEVELHQQRLARPFYGRFKYIKFYEKNEAKVINFVNKNITNFKKNFNEYNSSLIYFNHKYEKNLLIFGVNCLYLIEIDRVELKTKIQYLKIKAIKKINDYKIDIKLKTSINGKKHTYIKLSKKNNKDTVVDILKMFQNSLEQIDLQL